MTPRIAILLANNDDSSFSARFPNDGEKVAARLRFAEPSWHCKVWSVKDDEFPMSTDADAYIITGSPASVHDDWPWIIRLARLVQEIHRSRMPLVGFCFGHQLIATALGGAVEKSPTGWRFGAVETEFETSRPWMQPAQARLRLFASHSEQVVRLPEGATLLGHAPHCPYASYGIGSHILTTQYHPEFTRDFMKALSLEYRGELPDAVLHRGGTELDLETDGRAFFMWISRFFELSWGAYAERSTRT